MNDFATKAPPNASNANKTLNITIVGIFFGSIPAKLSITFYFGALASIDVELSIIP